MLGEIILESSGDKLSALYFKGQYNSDSAIDDFHLDVFIETKKWLECYFSGKPPSFTPPLQLSGSEFSMQVCEILLTIPYGKTKSYKEIASVLAKKRGLSKMSAQAIGGALKRNKIAIIVPCHRVIGTNGNLIGYAGGIDRKIKLLQLEGVKLKSFSK